MKKKLFAFALCVIMAVTMAVPAFADGKEPGIEPYSYEGYSFSSVGCHNSQCLRENIFVHKDYIGAGLLLCA